MVSGPNNNERQIKKKERETVIIFCRCSAPRFMRNINTACMRVQAVARLGRETTVGCEEEREQPSKKEIFEIARVALWWL